MLLELPSADLAATGKPKGGRIMLGWSLAFLIFALIAAVLGFGGLAAASAGIAKLLFFVFLILFVVSLVFRGFSRVP